MHHDGIMSTSRLTARDKRRIAVLAECDPRSVDSTIEGTAREVVAERVKAAAKKLRIKLPGVAA